MKIALIAMSGIRVCDGELLRLGLTLPGFVERSRTIASLPSLVRKRQKLRSIQGSVPLLTEIPPGCPFHPRCPYALPGQCDRGAPPPLETLAPGHQAACLRVREIPALREAQTEG